MSDHVYRRAAASATEWVGRIVYESAANTVQLSDDPTAEIPLGVVAFVDDTDGQDVAVCVGGRAFLRVGAAGLTAGTSMFVAAANDAGDATQDGKGVDAVAADYYVGRVNIHADAVEDDLVEIFVSVGQLDSDT